ncbi:hypothetical protein HD806DRAFT_136861 [Xylariaceae sp. AK1471]|nr:hypothetical protein HD806DRAFT_136861 [Xylariaceae sp. AK1471]
MDPHPWGNPPPYDRWVDDVLFWLVIGTLVVYFTAFAVNTTFYILRFIYRVLVFIAPYVASEPWIRSYQAGIDSLESWIKSWLDDLLAFVRKGYFSMVHLVFSILVWLLKAIWIVASLAMVAGLIWFVCSVFGITTAGLYARLIRVSAAVGGLSYAAYNRVNQMVRRGRERFRSLPRIIVFWVLLLMLLVIPFWMFRGGYFWIMIGVTLVLWWEASNMIMAYHDDLQLEPIQDQQPNIRRNLQPDFQDDLEIPDVPPPAYNADVRPPHYLYADYLNHPLINGDDDDGDLYIDPRSPSPPVRAVVPAPRDRLGVAGGVEPWPAAREIDLLTFFDWYLEADIRERVATENQLVIVARRLLYSMEDDELVRVTVDTPYRIQRIEEIAGYCSRVLTEEIWNYPRYSRAYQELILTIEDWEREYYEANRATGAIRQIR